VFHLIGPDATAASNVVDTFCGMLSRQKPGRGQSRYILSYYPGILLEVLRKTTELPRLTSL
jgi:hypothetical protein